MKTYAVVETGGKQYRVEPGQSIEVERLDAEIGAEIDALSVLAFSDGETIAVGTPTLEDHKVVFNVVIHKRGRKLFSFKKKRRKGYRRKVGHRQELTVLKVASIA